MWLILVLLAFTGLGRGILRLIFGVLLIIVASAMMV